MSKIPLLIFGTENFAEIAYEYFTEDSNYQVVGFTVDKEYIRAKTKFNLPIYSFEDIENYIDPFDHSFFAAITYSELNDVRKNKLEEAKKKGFVPASYVSSRSFVWPNAIIGEHCFIFEDNTIQPFVTIGSNVVMWSGNHIGHHSKICDSIFISSHVVISGNCLISDNCFIGVNATLSNNISVGPRSWIGPNALITRDLPFGSLVTTAPSKIKELNEVLLNTKLRQISSENQISNI